MRSDGAAAIIALLVVAVISAVFGAIFDLGRWFVSELHWLQILGPVVTTFVLLVTCWDFINTFPEWVFKLLGGTAAGGPVAFAFAWTMTEGAIWDFVVYRVPLWLTVSVVALIYCPLAAAMWIDAWESGKKRGQWRGRFDWEENRREPFGSAGKTSDEKLRDLGMI